MARAPVNKRRKPAKKGKSSAVPVLFTLGIIGWGFFAIDRLTTPLVETSQVESGKNSSFKSYSKREEKPFKEKVLSFIESVAGNDKERAEKELRIIKEKDEPAATKEIKPVEREQVATSDIVRDLKVYFYQVKADEKIRIGAVKRRITASSEDKQIFKLVQLLIKGPNATERMHDYTHSFKSRPRLIWAKRKEDTILLNFDQKFGTGVSFNLLRLQINQLLRTSLQFPGVKAISILIKGRKVKHLGGDGLRVPEKINQSNWSVTI